MRHHLQSQLWLMAWNQLHSDVKKLTTLFSHIRLLLML